MPFSRPRQSSPRVLRKLIEEGGLSHLLSTEKISEREIEQI